MVRFVMLQILKYKFYTFILYYEIFLFIYLLLLFFNFLKYSIGSVLYQSPEQQYKNQLKLKINNDNENQYKILTEDFYEMKIKWNRFENSLFYSPNFKIGNYIW